MIEGVTLFFADPVNMLVFVGSILISLFLLVLWEKYNRPLLLYLHLVFVLSPLFFFAVSINCSFGMVNGLLELCTMIIAKLMIYLLPPIMACAFIAGYILLPRLYSRRAQPYSSREFNRLCKRVNAGSQLLVLDKAKPIAFTLGKSVFVSVGMFELLSSKELEAVLLHELAHVKARSAWNKFSAGFVRLFSPIAWFSPSTTVREERCADAFAVSVQGTKKFLISAKSKVEAFQ